MNDTIGVDISKDALDTFWLSKRKHKQFANNKTGLRALIRWVRQAKVCLVVFEATGVYPIGYVHIDIAEVRTSERKLRLFVAIDRTSKFVYVELHQRAGKMVAAQFLRNFIAILPYRIHTIPTPSHGLQANHCRAVDNGIQFTNRKQDTTAFEHIFDRVCRENEIEHRLTKIAHPSWACKHAQEGNAWTNGQVGRMNRTLKEATVKRYHYDTHDQLKTHLPDFVDAYNYARRLKTLSGLTPFEYICKIWTSEPERFTVNPTHHKRGPYT